MGWEITKGDHAEKRFQVVHPNGTAEIPWDGVNDPGYDYAGDSGVVIGFSKRTIEYQKKVEEAYARGASFDTVYARFVSANSDNPFWHLDQFGVEGDGVRYRALDWLGVPGISIALSNLRGMMPHRLDQSPESFRYSESRGRSEYYKGDLWIPEISSHLVELLESDLLVNPNNLHELLSPHLSQGSL